jgi:ATP synthase protein I
MRQTGTSQAKRILWVQTIFSLTIMLFALPFGGWVMLSVLAGAGASLLANTLLAMLVFRDYRAQETSRLVMRFYGGEAARIALTLGLFAAALAAFDELNVPVMLGAYFVAQVIPTLIAAQFGSRNTK